MAPPKEISADGCTKKELRVVGRRDVYLPLAEEVRLLERAGFAVDVPWRRSPFAVIVGCRFA